ncbi:hypothetical protein Scep_017528 [Stephania cephalantha]|uniref:Uncharacterized protein n=1 Tax=Stephania cephalantha TaxID=152367 RepID=A0AAP0IQ91_9MAGN
MDATVGSDLVEGASADPAEKAEGKAAAAGRRGKEGRLAVQLERRTVKIVHLTTETDGEESGGQCRER